MNSEIGVQLLIFQILNELVSGQLLHVFVSAVDVLYGFTTHEVAATLELQNVHSVLLI